MNITISDRWNFIEKYLPNYHQNDEVLFLDICYRYLNPYEKDEVDERDIEMIESNFSNEDEIREYIAKSEKRLFLEACENLYDNFEEFDNE